MKKIIVLTLLTVGLNAGAWSALSGMTMEERKTISSYTLDTNGVNPRIYEFTPKNAPEMHCILVVLTGTEPSSTLQCFNKKGL